MDDAKIYNVCLMRVKLQITNAKQRISDGSVSAGPVILESYNTSDIDDIIDILEIYDLDDRTYSGLAEKLNDLAYTVSVLVKDKLEFNYDERGNLGLYLLLKDSIGEVKYKRTGAALAAA